MKNTNTGNPFLAAYHITEPFEFKALCDNLYLAYRHLSCTGASVRRFVFPCTKHSKTMILEVVKQQYDANWPGCFDKAVEHLTEEITEVRLFFPAGVALVLVEMPQ